MKVLKDKDRKGFITIEFTERDNGWVDNDYWHRVVISEKLAEQLAAKLNQVTNEES